AAETELVNLASGQTGDCRAKRRAPGRAALDEGDLGSVGNHAIIGERRPATRVKANARIVITRPARNWPIAAHIPGENRERIGFETRVRDALPKHRPGYEQADRCNRAKSEANTAEAWVSFHNLNS